PGASRCAARRPGVSPLRTRRKREEVRAAWCLLVPVFMPDIRERALVIGVQSLSDAELLAMVIGTGTVGESVSLTAAALLESPGGLEGIVRLGPHGFTERRGLGPAKAARIAAALELGRRATLRALAE